MHIDLKGLIAENETVAVAISGGSDSVALLHYILSARKIYPFNVIALNVEHGIRGAESVRDSAFVQALCKKWGVELISYAVNSPQKADEEKLSLEQAARALRYECFFDAINKGLCNKVATAHHRRDNVESVLFNLFRGTGINGVTGITQNFNGKIIRPFLNVGKEEIDEYVNNHSLEFVTDQTNFDNEYTRNYIRLNILPEIKKIFPEVEKSVSRFAQIAKSESDYIEEQVKNAVTESKGAIEIALPLHPALLARATVYAMKAAGVEKDWEKAHVDGVIALATARNGARVDLKKGIFAVKEYDKIVLTKSRESIEKEFPFSVGERLFCGQKILIEKAQHPCDLKRGLYGDLDKIPASAVLRFKRNGDRFTKFGGGTKSLNDYFTDKKIPLRMRNFIPLVADGQDILAVFGVAVSDKIKVDETTKNIIKFTQEDDYEKH